jgi:hypothetical protein
VVVVVVADDYGVDVWDVLDLARHVRVSLGSHEADWAAPGREDRIEEDSEATRKLQIVASMTQPSRTQLLSLSRGQKVGLEDRDGRWSGVRSLPLSSESSPSHCADQFSWSSLNVRVPRIDEAFAMLVVVSLLLNIGRLGRSCAWR